MNALDKLRIIEQLVTGIEFGIHVSTHSIESMLTPRFYVRLKYTEISSGDILSGIPAYGQTIPDAIDMAWEKLTNLKPGECIVRGAYTPDRAEYRWNGQTWQKGRYSGR